MSLRWMTVIVNLHHLFDGAFKAVGDKVDWLVFGDRILLKAGDGRIEFFYLRLIGEAVLELSKARQQSGSVSFKLAMLTAHSILDCEPEARRQPFDEVVGCAERSQSDFLRELCEGGIGEERRMTEQLVHDIGLGCVERLAGVSDVLSRVEAAEG